MESNPMTFTKGELWGGLRHILRCRAHTSHEHASHVVPQICYTAAHQSPLKGLRTQQQAITSWIRTVVSGDKCNRGTCLQAHAYPVLRLIECEPLVYQSLPIVTIYHSLILSNKFSLSGHMKDVNLEASVQDSLLPRLLFTVVIVVRLCHITKHSSDYSLFASTRIQYYDPAFCIACE